MTFEVMLIQVARIASQGTHHLPRALYGHVKNCDRNVVVEKKDNYASWDTYCSGRFHSLICQCRSHWDSQVYSERVRTLEALQ